MNQLVRHSYQGGDPCDGDPDMSRDHKHLNACQKQHRKMNQLVRHSYQGGDPCDGDPDMSRDHRRLTICQKQYRQNETARRVDIPTGVEVRMTGRSQTGVLTTDVSPLVKNNTDRMNQLFR